MRVSSDGAGAGWGAIIAWIKGKLGFADTTAYREPMSAAPCFRRSARVSLPVVVL
ncbi:MAG: hypothetical protein FWD73_04445 [Polyangiaceae bacterium]|nr:hypothetical protein [Polyangiaceae bacterium]